MHNSIPKTFRIKKFSVQSAQMAADLQRILQTLVLTLWDRRVYHRDFANCKAKFTKFIPVLRYYEGKAFIVDLSSLFLFCISQLAGIDFMRKQLTLMLVLVVVSLLTMLPAHADFQNAGIIRTIAGTGAANYTGDGGPAINATLDVPQQITTDTTGNLYIADRNNAVIRKIDTNGIITTVAGGGTLTPNNVPAMDAQLVSPAGVAVDSAGHIYIGDGEANFVYKVDATTGLISVFAGTGADASDGDGGLATAAAVNYPQGIALDSAGHVYIAEFDANKIRKVDTNTGIITTVVGTGGESYAGDGGPALAANLNDPWDVFLDKDDNIFIADFDSHVIRRVDAITGIITTVAGNNVKSFGGDGGLATSASLNWPVGVFVDDGGDIYIADGFNQRVRVVDAATGIISTLGGNGNPSSSGDGGPVTEATFNGAADVWIDGSSLYISEVGSHLIREVFLPQYPTGLAVDTEASDLTTAPVTPTLTWVHQTEAGQTAAPADDYQVYVRRVNAGGSPTLVINEIYAAADICSGVTCSITTADLLPSWGLLSGAYEWWVGARYDGGSIVWSGGESFDAATFTVAVPPASLPATITIDPRQGRPLLSWPDDPNTLWAQVWIGPNSGSPYLKWAQRDGDPDDNTPDFTCADGTCSLAPPINFTAANNPYKVWMRFWSPGGYSSGGTDSPNNPSWKLAGDLTLPGVAPLQPAEFVVTGLDASNLTFTWPGMENATWYRVEIAPVDGPWNYGVWNLGYDLSTACGDATGDCVLVDPVLDGVLQPGDYVVRVRAWGPGGMGPFTADQTITYAGAP